MQPCFILCGILFIIVPVIMFVIGYKQLKIRNLIRDTTTSRIGNLKEGLAEVYGDVVPINLIRAPITGIECAHYSYKVEEYRRSGKHSRWVPIDQGSSDGEFYVQDDTGQAKVRPFGADFKVDPTFNASSSSGFPPLVLAFLQQRNIPLTGGLFGFARMLRVSETVLVPGKKLYIFGAAVPDPASRAGNLYYVITKSDKPPLLIISERAEGHVLSGYTVKAVVFMVLSGVFACFGLFMLLLGLIT